MKARDWSLVGMISGSVFIITANIIPIILNGKIATKEEQESICLASIILVAIFSPVYINLIIEKFIGSKNNDKKVE
jgi:hypothetical protein